MPPKKAESALKGMSKSDLAKLRKSLKDFESAKEDATAALAKALKDKIGKRGISIEAWKLADKINDLNNAQKQQGFLRDFDVLRELFGWDDQKNLFEEDKTAVQKKDETKALPPAGKAAAEAKSKSGAAAAKANSAVNKRSEKATKRVGRLFGEDDSDDGE